MSTQTAAKAAPKIDLSTAKWPIGFAIAAVVVVIFYGFVLPDLDRDVQRFFQDWLPLSELNYALVWALSAIGLNVVVGYAGLLDLGFVAFWAIGGYTMAWLGSYFIEGLKVHLGGTPAPAVESGVHLHPLMILVAAAILCAIAGVIIGAPTLRLRSDYLAIVTMGFGEIISQFVKNADEQSLGVNITNGTQGIHPIDRINGLTIKQGEIGWGAMGPFDPVGRFVIFAVLTALVIFACLRIRHGRLGRAWMAIREDELAASAMGVPLMRAKLSAYAVGAVCGGIGGVAYAIHLDGILPDPLNFSISITLLAMVVLGGMGNVWGVLLAALIVSWFNTVGLQQFGKTINESFDSNINFPSFTFLIFGGALVLMMLFRREGLLPETRTRLVLHEGAADDTEAEAPPEELVEEKPEESL